MVGGTFIDLSVIFWKLSGMLSTRGSNGKRYEEVDTERVIDVFKRKETNTISIQKRGTMYISCLQNKGCCNLEELL
jgi:hypothetical protein